jgi:hypothetical protein
LLLLPLIGYSAELEGVKIPPTTICEGKEIPLHGFGIRTATIFKIKVYVLGFYSENLDSRPMCFHLTYLNDFSGKDVDRAWDYQFKESAEHKYPEFKNHVEELKKFFGEITGERTQFIQLTNETTKFYENGKLKGEIQSMDFQKTFLSIWFGKNPPTKELKEALLKKPST